MLMKVLALTVCFVKDAYRFVNLVCHKYLFCKCYHLLIVNLGAKKFRKLAKCEQALTVMQISKSDAI